MVFNSVTKLVCYALLALEGADAKDHYVVS